ncbi:hypothetical protein EDB87DRAFT_571978 [Lactarius vividus]|nr:hypothetical protein EDB87DRAFT_571978 [Lactarius vividus]
MIPFNIFPILVAVRVWPTLAPTLSHSSTGTHASRRTCVLSSCTGPNLAFVQGLPPIKPLLYTMIWPWQCSHFWGTRNRDSCTLSRAGNPRSCHMFGLYTTA